MSLSGQIHQLWYDLMCVLGARFYPKKHRYISIFLLTKHLGRVRFRNSIFRSAQCFQSFVSYNHPPSQGLEATKQTNMKQLALFVSLIVLGLSVQAQQCSADFNYSVNGSTIDFTNTSTGQLDWVSWDFGDGNYSNSIDPSHTYSNSGLYIVCLTIIDSTVGCSDTWCDSVYVQSGSGGGGCNLSFSVADNGGTIVGSNSSSGAAYYEWYIWGPSGMAGPISGYNLNYTAPSTGNYSVCLYGYDSAQVWCDSTCMSLFVQANTGGGGCSASFNMSTNGSTISTTNTSSGSNAYYSWDVWTPSGYDGPFYTTDLTYNASVTGNYTVCLSVYDSIQGWCDSTCQTTYIQTGGSGGGCNLSFNLSSNGSTISGTNTSIGASYFDWYVWGPQGQQGPFNTTDLTFTAPVDGNYYVCLYGYDSAQVWCDSVCQNIYVQTGSGGGCNASFNLSSSGNTISGTNTSTGGFYYDWYVWTPSGIDGPYTTNNLTYSATQSGNYTVCLSAYDSIQGWCDSTCQNVFIQGGGGNCAASFYPVQDTASSQYTDSWYFVNTSTGAALDYAWDFGDGNTSGQQNPFHTYASPGTYLVCLTITSQQDSTCYSTSCDSVVVLTVGQAEYLIDESSIELYPNPVENQATLNMFARRNADVTVTIYSAVGQLVDREQVAVREGTNTVQLQTANLNSGIYLVEVATDNSKNVIRFVKR